MITLELSPDVKLEVWPETQYLHTIFFPNKQVRAAPENTPDYWHRAHKLGYTSAWHMCLEHELLHTLLAPKGISYTLWGLAHELDMDQNIVAEEEAKVLEFQRLLNKCRNNS